MSKSKKSNENLKLVLYHSPMIQSTDAVRMKNS